MILRFSSNEILEIVEANKEELIRTKFLCTAYVEGFQGKKWVRKAEIPAIFGDRFIPVGMLKLLQEEAKTNLAYKIQIQNSELWKIDSINLSDFEKQIDAMNMPFEPYEYQYRFAVYPIMFSRAFCAGCTSSGKTLISYMSIVWSVKYREIKKALVIVPSVILVEQFANDYTGFNTNCDTKIKAFKIYAGAQNEHAFADCNVVVSTYQSMSTWPKEHTQIFDYLFVDEAHTANALSVISIIRNLRHVKYRFGMTGTLPKDKLSVQNLYSYIGFHFETYTARELIASGRGTPIRVIPVIIQNSKDVCKKLHSTLLEPMYEDNPDSEPILESKSRVLSEEQLVSMTSKNRTSELCKIITSFDLNILVLSKRVRVIHHIGEELRKYCEEHSINKSIHIIAGNVNKSTHEREAIKLAIEADSYHNILVGNMDILSTGVSIKGLFNSVFLNIGKSDTKVIQALGRLMRLHELKKIATILDISDQYYLEEKIDNRLYTYNRTGNYLRRHQKTRLLYYIDEGHTVEKTLTLTISE